jgi:hypothetical protein
MKKMDFIRSIDLSSVHNSPKRMITKTEQAIAGIA